VSKKDSTTAKAVTAEQARRDERHSRLTAEVLKHACEIVTACDASALFVYADALEGREWQPPKHVQDKVIYVTKTEGEQQRELAKARQVIRVPDIALTRMGQIKMAVLLAMSRGLLKRGDIIVCLSGVAESGTLDTVMVMEVGEEFELFLSGEGNGQLPRDVQIEVLERVIDIAMELACEGREGKPVGALFVIGDTEKVFSLSKQLIINPFKGYPEEERNILDPALEETIKELSAVDGAFIIRGDGVIEAAGAYLKASSSPDSALPAGLGARHQAAAGITAMTDAVAVTISQSTGTVMVFRNGKILIEIEKPRSAAVGRRI